MNSYSKTLLLFFLLSLLLINNTFAQSKTNNTLKGKITNLQKSGIEGVTIQFPALQIGTISKADGSYSFTHLPAGNYLIEITHIGFSPIAQTIHIQSENMYNFTLEESVAEHSEIVVTGSAVASLLKQSPQTISILKKKELWQIAATNIVEALSKTIPGVAAIATGAAISKPIIRGLGYNRVLVMHDGAKQEGQQWGDEHGIEIDNNSVQKVEVLKGPAAIIYGSGAMGGVINLTTQQTVEKNTIKGSLLYDYMHNNGLNGGYGNIAGHLSNGLNWNFYGSRQSAYAYKNKYDGRVFNSGYNDWNIGGQMGINKSWGFSHLLFTYFNQNVGLIEGARDSLTGAFLMPITPDSVAIVAPQILKNRTLYTPNQNIQHYKITADNNFILKKGNITCNLSYQENLRKEFSNIAEPKLPALFFNLQTFIYTAQYHFPEKNNWHTSLGINGSFQNNRNKAAEALIPAYHQTETGIFTYSKKTVGKWAWSGGLRIDTRELKTKELKQNVRSIFSSIQNRYTNISGGIGFAVAATDKLSFKWNLSRAYRAPVVFELTSNGLHEGTAQYMYGDKNLKSETSLQTEGELLYATKHFNFEFTPYLNRINNYIFYHKLANTSGIDSTVGVDGSIYPAFEFNQSAATLYGFEVQLDIHPHPLDWLHFENSFAYVRGIFNQSFDGAKNLPMMPAPLWKSQLRGDFRQINKWIKNPYIELSMHYNFAQNKIFTAYNTELPSPAYIVWNMSVGGSFKIGKQGFQLYCVAQNFTNTAYQNHLSRLRYLSVNEATGRRGVYNMGRNFSVKMIIPFSFNTK